MRPHDSKGIKVLIDPRGVPTLGSQSNGNSKHVTRRLDVISNRCWSCGQHLRRDERGRKGKERPWMKIDGKFDCESNQVIRRSGTPLLPSRKVSLDWQFPRESVEVGASGKTRAVIAHSEDRRP